MGVLGIEGNVCVRAVAATPIPHKADLFWPITDVARLTSRISYSRSVCTCLVCTCSDAHKHSHTHARTEGHVNIRVLFKYALLQTDKHKHSQTACTCNVMTCLNLQIYYKKNVKYMDEKISKGKYLISGKKGFICFLKDEFLR